MQSTIKEINNAINIVDGKMKTLSEEKIALEKTKGILFKVNDLCPECEGSAYYYRQSNGGDPYERSSDLREKCPRCKGTGKYHI